MDAATDNMSRSQQHLEGPLGPPGSVSRRYALVVPDAADERALAEPDERGGGTNCRQSIHWSAALQILGSTVIRSQNAFCQLLWCWTSSTDRCTTIISPRAYDVYIQLAIRGSHKLKLEACLFFPRYRAVK